MNTALPRRRLPIGIQTFADLRNLYSVLKDMEVQASLNDSLLNRLVGELSASRQL